MELLDIYQKIDKFVEKHNLSKETAADRKDLGIGKTKDLAQTLAKLEDDARLLKIGIIGRVNAGKSSLLNALIFEGKNILPKAATPMTAALTTMTYSEAISAKLDFFEQEDIEIIKQQHDAFEQNLKEKQAEKEADLKERQRSKYILQKATDALNQIELSADDKAKAQRQALREMKSHPYADAHDQYQRIQGSGLNLQDATRRNEIHANSIDELMNGELKDFVGAEGRYMPFTKSVNLFLPLDELKDLEIIDTPGINDPIQSRGARTEELLKQCDVVFAVSPAGQFLSAEDTDLLERLATKDGVQEIYLVASQTDTQLFGSEAQGKTDPIQVLSSIEDTLSTHAKDVLQQKQHDVPQMKTILEKCLAHKVICTSGVVFNMLKQTDTRGWDSNMAHVLTSLKQCYPHNFSSTETQQATLQKLANIDVVQSKIQQVRDNKNTILAQKKQTLAAQKRAAVVRYFKKIDKYVQHRISELNNKDIEQIKSERDELNLQSEKLSFYVDTAYENLVEDMDVELNRHLNEILKQSLRAFSEAESNSQGSYSEEYEACTGRVWGFLWKEYETRSRTIHTVSTSLIKKAIKEIRIEIEDKLKEESAEYKKAWRETLKKTLLVEMKKIIDYSNIDIYRIDKSVKNIVSLLPESNFKLKGELPAELKKSGKLESSEGDRFLDAAREYLSGLRDEVRGDIAQFVTHSKNELSAVCLSKDLTEDLSRQLDELENELKHKEVSLQRYANIQNEQAQLLDEVAA